MSTRATIQFKDEWGQKLFVYRGHDGFPEDVIPDIERVIEEKKRSWSGSDIFQLVTWFLILTNNPNHRLADYELTTSFHGDESFSYFVQWNENGSCWEIIDAPND
jgi:hypothetical protein